MMDLNIPVTIFKEESVYIAYSPVLDLSTSASTFEKVQKRFTEVVVLFFEEITKMGTLDDVLTNLGWRRIDKTWNPPVQISHEMTKVSIPLNN